MTTTVKPVVRVPHSWEELGDLDMQFDFANYESMPPSVTNPELATGQSSAGGVEAWCNGIDFDYMATGGGEGDFYAVYAVPDGGTFEEDAVIMLQSGAAAGWTHVHQDLAPGIWEIVFGVSQTSGTPLFFWIDNVEILPASKLTGYAPTFAEEVAYPIPAGSLTLTPQTPVSAIVAVPPAGSIVLTARNPAAIWTVPASMLPTSRVIFQCILTGGATGLADVTVPISSFQGTLRDGDPSYLSVVIPSLDSYTTAALAIIEARTAYLAGLTATFQAAIDAVDAMLAVDPDLKTLVDAEFADILATGIADGWIWTDHGVAWIEVALPAVEAYVAGVADAGGEIVIKKGYLFADGSTQMEEIARVTYESVAIDQGARSEAVTLTGHKTVTAIAPKERTVSGASFSGLQADGKRRIRAEIDTFLRPGDTCIFGTGADDYFTVGQITFWASARPAVYLMEVTEA